MRSSSAARLVVTLVALGLALTAGTASAATSTVVDLGTLGGQTSEAEAVSALGQVVGAADTAGGIRHAFSWRNGVMTDLGSLGGASAAHGVNVLGQVVGDSQTALGATHAFLYSGGTMTDLNTLFGPSFFPGNGTAHGINASGLIVGTADTQTLHRDFEAIVNPPDFFTSLGGLGSEGWGVNNLGDVAGFDSGTMDPQAVANGPVLAEYTAFLGATSTAFAINANDQVAGSIGPDAMIWNPFLNRLNPQPQHLLGEFGESVAYALNNTGVAVGTSSDAFHQGLAADAMEWFIASSTAVDLNTTIGPGDGWHLSSARGVNDSLGIVGRGTHNGVERAFLLSPYVWLRPPVPVNLPGRIRISLVAGPVRPAPGDPVARLFIAPIDPAGGVGQETPAVPYGDPSGGNTFQRLPGGIYTFALARAGLSPGRYQLRVDLGDGIAETTYTLTVTPTSAAISDGP